MSRNKNKIKIAIAKRIIIFAYAASAFSRDADIGVECLYDDQLKALRFVAPLASNVSGKQLSVPTLTIQKKG